MRTTTPLLTLGFLALLAPLHGASGAAWLAYPGSARNVAEAGGLGVMADGVQSLGLNPAGLAAVNGQGQAQLSHSSWAADIKAEHVSASFDVGGGRAALAGSWVDFGSVQGYRYDAVLGNVPEGQLRPSAAALGLSLARSFGASVEGGVTGQWLMQNLTGAGYSHVPSMDAGLRAHSAWGLHGGLSLVHLGGEIDGSALPTALKLGLAYRPEAFRWELGVEGSRPLGLETVDLAGALRLHLGDALVARAGWLQMQGQTALPSFGASFIVGPWTLDYAYRGNDALGATHHIGMEFAW